MSEDFLQVYIEDGGTTIGVGKIHSQAARGYETATFIYDREWLERDGAYPLEPEMPLSKAPFASGGRNKTALPAAVRDGSPDRWGRKLILRSRAKGDERSRTVTEVDYLLGLDDFTRIGALRYRTNGDGAYLGESHGARVPPIIALTKLLNAADAVSRDKETDADLRYLLGFGSPLGGARPKSVVREADGSLAIAKFAKHDDPRTIALGEVIAATIAERAGIRVAPSRMLTVAGQQISIIRRFDRNPEGGREHFISAMALLGAEEGDSETYVAIAESIRVHGANVRSDLEELWRRMVLNVLNVTEI